MSLKRQLAVALGTIVVVGLLAMPAVAAKGLNWNETDKNGKVAVLNFRVTSVTVTQTTWTAHVSVANLSKQTVQVGDGFGIAFFTDAKTTDPAKASALVKATAFSPARPTVLRPGARWTGVISGAAALLTAKTSGYSRIIFGSFQGVPGQTRAISWITDHETLVSATSLKPSEPIA